jgi:hypothetical protein
VETTGVVSDCACGLGEAACISMAQWCAPCRRQQAGRLASWLASSADASGDSKKSRTRKMENPRRILRIMVHEVDGKAFAISSVFVYYFLHGRNDLLSLLYAPLGTQLTWV